MFPLVAPIHRESLCFAHTKKDTPTPLHTQMLATPDPSTFVYINLGVFLTRGTALGWGMHFCWFILNAAGFTEAG